MLLGILCSGAGGHPAEQGLPQRSPAARALLWPLNSVPALGVVPPGAQKHKGCGRTRAQAAWPSEPALCRAVGRGKGFF